MLTDGGGDTDADANVDRYDGDNGNSDSPDKEVTREEKL